MFHPLKKIKMTGNYLSPEQEMNRANHSFDMSIKHCYRYGPSSDQAKLAILNKELFNLTAPFSIRDWKNVRGSQFWKDIESMNELEEKKYLRDRILLYNQNQYSKVS